MCVYADCVFCAMLSGVGADECLVCVCVCVCLKGVCVLCLGFNVWCCMRA